VAPPLTVPIHQAVLAMSEVHSYLFRNLGPKGIELTVATQGEPFTV